MRPHIAILVLLAFGVAAVTVVLFSRVMSHRQEPAPAAVIAAAPATVEILVAAGDIKPGEVIKPGDLRYAPWSDAALDERYVRKDAAREVKDDFVGAIARRPFLAGEPMNSAAVFHRNEAGVMSGLLSPGMRALSIAVSPTSDVAGFVLPNDHVDILLDQDVHAATGQVEEHPGRNGVVRFAAEAILRDVRVVAVDDKLAKADNAVNQQGKTVTVEVAAKDAETLILAARMGELVLALRSVTPDPPPPVAAGGFVGDVMASSALKAAVRPDIILSASGGTVRINRGGAISTQSFAF